MSDVILHIHGLRKTYGKKVALKGLNLDINRGDIYGLIGPNGAGKTTTFKSVATILTPIDGLIRICGMDLADKKKIREIRRKIGYMPDSFGVYEDMTVREYLSFFAAAYDIVNPKRNHLVDDVLELVDLDVKRDALVDTLSRGMQQRLGLARTLIHDPELLILDEPASGLDPRARVEIRSLLVELQKMGKTILISSHILADIGEICNRVGILEQGELKLDGTVDDILARVKPSPIINIRVAERQDAAQLLLEQQPFIKQVQDVKGILAVEIKKDFTATWEISKLLVDNGYQLTFFQPEARNLEHAFMEFTEGNVS